MKRENENLQKNISRLVKRSADADSPSAEFTAKLTNEALGELKGRSHSVRLGRWAKIAAAAVIIAAAGLFVCIGNRPGQVEDRRYAADMLTVAVLNAAFRDGDMEDVERLCEAAAKGRGYRPEKLTVDKLIAELEA